MNSKLFIVMGVPWSFELLDMAYPDSKELCWVWEILNMSMGICVCSIFVFKRSVIKALTQKCGEKYHWNLLLTHNCFFPIQMFQVVKYQNHYESARLKPHPL